MTRRPKTSLPVRLAALIAFAVALSGCSSRSVDHEARLIEVHGDRAYLCLADGMNLSDPPSCIAEIGTKNNPELHGRMVPELISVLGRRSDSVNVSAAEVDGRWLLEGFAAPR